MHMDALPVYMCTQRVQRPEEAIYAPEGSYRVVSYHVGAGKPAQVL